MTNNPQLDMLKKMMAGIPTKESQQLAVKTTILADEKNMGKYDSQMINEMVEQLPLPDMSGMEIPGRLPDPIPEDAIVALMEGRRPQPIQQRQPQQSQQPQVSITQMLQNQGRGANRVEEERDDNSPVALHEALRTRLAQKQKTNPVLIAESAKRGTSAIDGNLEATIEAIVIKVLAQMLSGVVKTKL